MISIKRIWMGQKLHNIKWSPSVPQTIEQLSANKSLALYRRKHSEKNWEISQPAYAQFLPSYLFDKKENMVYNSLGRTRKSSQCFQDILPPRYQASSLISNIWLSLQPALFFVECRWWSKVYCNCVYMQVCFCLLCKNLVLLIKHKILFFHIDNIPKDTDWQRREEHRENKRWKFRIAKDYRGSEVYSNGFWGPGKRN